MKRKRKTPVPPVPMPVTITGCTFQNGRTPADAEVALVLARAAEKNAEAIAAIAKGGEGAPGLIINGPA